MNNVEKLQKLCGLIDQMISQHAWLRDRYARRASTLDVILLVLSASLSALAFADIKGIVGGLVDVKLWLGGLSLTVFVASVVSWKVDWKGKENSHGQTVDNLSQQKREILALLDQEDGINSDTVAAVNASYAVISDKCAKVPESLFLKTKQYHKRKVALSRALDVSPGTFLWVIKLKLWWQHTRK
ncbi:hypothetical protein ACFO5Q_08870 [Kordiimonas lipolytica]|uniref:SMODS and SLOG-associating 2TM effector domain-containing protein n=1 Tax=Kordiimonas lipolytica TaxID=1662421 RepID=A0ABV8UAS5_9PROT|nr:hypothetical protein [Kordiimonas lipolytica]